jgi:hypothetical protein
VTDQVSASVLCPYFVPTGISQSHRNKPAALADEKPTQSQLIGQAMSDKAVGSGKITAAEVAQMVFDAIATTASTSTATRGRWAMCARAWRTSSPPPTRWIRFWSARRSARNSAPRCGRVEGQG